MTEKETIAHIPSVDVLAEGGYQRIENLWAAYRQFLLSADNRLDATALEFARAPWHHDNNDARGIHDATVVCVEVLCDECQRLRIQIRLLNRGETQYIDMKYRGVIRYSLAFDSDNGSLGSRDLLIDEFGVSDAKLSTHTLVFGSGDKWRFEFSSFEYSFEEL